MLKILGKSRSGYYKSKGLKQKKRSGSYACKDDEEICLKIKKIISERPSYGYKRVTVLLNRDFGTHYNRKRIYRIMRQNELLVTRKKSTKSRGAHTGKVMVIRSNVRWSSDCFEVRCWNDERVYVIFAIDCCDREIISFICTTEYINSGHVQKLMTMAIEVRFNSSAKAPQRIEWLSDRGSIYRALETQNRARQLGLKPCFTAAYSPSSNGMSEAFVGTIKRDYVYTNDCSDAKTTLNALPLWIKDYNEKAPHSGLAMRSPSEYRQGIKTG